MMMEHLYYQYVEEVTAGIYIATITAYVLLGKMSKQILSYLI